MQGFSGLSEVPEHSPVPRTMSCGAFLQLLAHSPSQLVGLRAVLSPFAL